MWKIDLVLSHLSPVKTDISTGMAINLDNPQESFEE